MVDATIVKLKVWGEFACFTRPDLKVERMSYPCMTASAARGIFDSILWKPEFNWYIRKINILKPIHFFSIKRNELKSKQSEQSTPIIIENDRTQRNGIILKDVAYIIEASVFQEKFDAQNMPRKYVEMFNRRAAKGQCYRRPFFGTREFSLEFALPDGNETPISDTIPIGSMFFDMLYDENGNPQPVYIYDTAIINGSLSFDGLAENDMLMKSTHILPQDEKHQNTIAYFRTAEEEEHD